MFTGQHNNVLPENLEQIQRIGADWTIFRTIGLRREGVARLELSRAQLAIGDSTLVGKKLDIDKRSRLPQLVEKRFLFQPF